MNICFHSALMFAAPVCLATLSLADSITLRPSIRLGPNAGIVTLSHIATLEGSHAAEFADLAIVVVDAGEGTREINLRFVREKLDEAGVHWGKVNLNGRSVILRPARNSAASPPMAMSTVSLDPESKTTNLAQAIPTELASDLVGQTNVRGTIATLIVGGMQLEADRVRLEFATQDASFLNTDAHVARIEAQPLGDLNSDRIGIGVRLWKNGLASPRRIISVLVTVRTTVATLQTNVERNHLIHEDDVVESEQWLPPSLAAMILNRVSAIGNIVNKPLRQGEMLLERQVHRETLMKRGDLAMVRCLIGGTVITLKAEARTGGGLGDIIEFQKQGERETFRATITGPGEALMDFNRKQDAVESHTASIKNG